MRIRCALFVIFCNSKRQANWKMNSVGEVEGCDRDGTAIVADELFETFYVNNNNNKKSKPFQVILSAKGIRIRRELEEDEVIDISDVVGSKCARERKQNKGASASCVCPSVAQKNRNTRAEGDPDSGNNKRQNVSAYLYIYCYELKRKEQRERRDLILCFAACEEFDDNMRQAEKWNQAIKVYKGNGALADNRPVLILLNPKSGSGKARELFHEQVKPILVEAELPYDLQVTKYACFAKELMHLAKAITKSWRGIIVVGGDGLYWEVLNGLLERPDWSDVLSELPIGIIPCGSGNGLARTIAHLYQIPFEPKPILNAAITCVSGRTSLMDLVRVETKTQIIYSFLSVGWGLIADIDIESERIRSLGYQRFTVWSIRRLVHLRTYHGKLSYIRNKNNKTLCGKRETISLTSPTDDAWTIEEGNFVMVHATYQTHLAEDCFFIPDAQLNDGIIHLVIIREGIRRMQLASFLIAMSSGTHLPTEENKFIEVIPVTVFRIEPTGNEGIIAVDGERIEYGAIQGEVLPGIVNVMVPK